MSENNVVAAIIEYLTYRRCLVLRINSGAAIAESATGPRRFLSFVRWYAWGLDPQTAGVADILAIMPGGVALVVEVKTPGRRGKTSPAQRRFLAEAAARGAVCVIACGVEDVVEALEGVVTR